MGKASGGGAGGSGGRGGGESVSMSFWGRGGNKGVTLQGNNLSGDTYKFSRWIKNELGGVWSPSTRTWNISNAGVEKLKAQGNNTRFGGS